jgi:hypothetical protein
MKSFVTRIIAFAFYAFCATASANTFEPAESAMTRDVIFRLRDAIRNFEKEYGYFPPLDHSKTLRLLQGDALDGYNWRKIVFWEARQPKRFLGFITKSGDFNDSGELIDGWQNPFQFEIDKSGFEIWSTGSSGKDDKTTAIRKDRFTILIPLKNAQQDAAANP